MAKYIIIPKTPIPMRDQGSLALVKTFTPAEVIRLLFTDSQTLLRHLDLFGYYDLGKRLEDAAKAADERPVEVRESDEHPALKAIVLKPLCLPPALCRSEEFIALARNIVDASSTKPEAAHVV